MYKATAKADQFNTRSGSEATKGSRKGYSLLGGGVDPASVLSEREARDNRHKALTASLAWELTVLREAKATMVQQFGTKNYFKAKDAKEQAVKRVAEVTAALTALKDERGAVKRSALVILPVAFMDVCREKMTKAQFQLYLDIAHKRLQDGNQLPAPLDET